jgi:hypothetical protein
MKTQPLQLPTSIILFKPCLDFVLSGLSCDFPHSYDAGGNYFLKEIVNFTPLPSRGWGLGWYWTSPEVAIEVRMPTPQELLEMPIGLNSKALTAKL